MASSITLYNHTALRIADATNILLPTGTFKITLHTSASNAATLTNTVYANLDNQITGAGGYTVGGETLLNPALTTVTTNDAKFTADIKVLTAVGGDIEAWRWAVIRRSDTVNSLTGPLIGFILGNTAPADIPATTVGNTLTFTWDTTGIILGTVA